MKNLVLLGGFLLWVAMHACAAAGLPEILESPTNCIVEPGASATLGVSAAGAVDYQWRHNGENIPWATNAYLIVTNAQSSDRGYYNVVVANAFGSVPSQLAYLSVVSGSGGLIPMHNYWSAYTQAHYSAGGAPSQELIGQPIYPGWAQVYAGPQADQMRPIGPEIALSEPGYFSAPPQAVPTVGPGDWVFYQVIISYPLPGWGDGTNRHPSNILVLKAGGGSEPVPSAEYLQFFEYIGGYSPIFFPTMYPTPQVRLPGETVELHQMCYTPCFSYPNPGYIQWRKDGNYMLGATNWVLTITNFQAGDVGIYDAVISCDNADISPKYNLSVQSSGGEGRLLNPRASLSGFSCDFEGARGRIYSIQASTNLADWKDVLVMTNVTGYSSFTTTNVLNSRTWFYRSLLQPQPTSW